MWASPEPTQLERLSDASFLGKLLVLPANVRLDWKDFTRCEHSSLFGLIIRNEEIFLITLTPDDCRWNVIWHNVMLAKDTADCTNYFFFRKKATLTKKIWILKIFKNQTFSEIIKKRLGCHVFRSKTIWPTYIWSTLSKDLSTSQLSTKWRSHDSVNKMVSTKYQSTECQLTKG